MLTNAELEQISRASTLLGMIWIYATEPNSNIYENTGVTSKDLHDCMKALTYIYTRQCLKKELASEKSNAYNKRHAEKHREYNREWERKNYKRRKGVK